MNLRGEVIQVETHGDTLLVTMQTEADRQASWMPAGRSTVAMPASAKNGRTYYVGRVVDLTTEPR